jgi:hypothetical protein
VHICMQAVMYFEKLYEVARSIGDAKILDAARINLGVASAAAQQEAFLGVVDSNLEALLHWKNLRAPFGVAP